MGLDWTRGLLSGIGGAASSYKDSLKEQEKFNYSQMQNIIQMNRDKQIADYRNTQAAKLQKSEQGFRASERVAGEEFKVSEREAGQEFRLREVETARKDTREDLSYATKFKREQAMIDARNQVAAAFPKKDFGGSDEDYQRFIDDTLAIQAQGQFAGKGLSAKDRSDIYLKISEQAKDLFEPDQTQERADYIRSEYSVALSAGAPVGATGGRISELYTEPKRKKAIKDIYTNFTEPKTEKTLTKYYKQEKGKATNKVALEAIEDAYRLNLQRLTQRPTTTTTKSTTPTTSGEITNITVEDGVRIGYKNGVKIEFDPASNRWFPAESPGLLSGIGNVFRDIGAGIKQAHR